MTSIISLKRSRQPTRNYLVPFLYHRNTQYSPLNKSPLPLLPKASCKLFLHSQYIQRLASWHYPLTSGWSAFLAFTGSSIINPQKIFLNQFLHCPTFASLLLLSKIVNTLLLNFCWTPHRCVGFLSTKNTPDLLLLRGTNFGNYIKERS